MKKCFLLICTSLYCLAACKFGLIKNDYAGLPYTDKSTLNSIQQIPGKIQCERYDLGGEGIAFHDTDTLNSGSGRLNRGIDYLSLFRKDEAVDVSFTKFHDSIDNSKYNIIDPNEGQLYVGWTEPGEWIKLTVDVEESGVYTIGLMYTSNGDGQISFSINDKDMTGLIDVTSTHSVEDPINWRQWHHWNYKEDLAQIKLNKGIQVLTFHTVTNGQMNYDFVSFKQKL